MSLYVTAATIQELITNSGIYDYSAVCIKIPAAMTKF